LEINIRKKETPRGGRKTPTEGETEGVTERIEEEAIMKERPRTRMGRTILPKGWS
jgi:hypothetical protein